MSQTRPIPTDHSPPLAPPIEGGHGGEAPARQSQGGTSSSRPRQDPPRLPSTEGSEQRRSALTAEAAVAEATASATATADKVKKEAAALVRQFTADGVINYARRCGVPDEKIAALKTGLAVAKYVVSNNLRPQEATATPERARPPATNAPTTTRRAAGEAAAEAAAKRSRDLLGGGAPQPQGASDARDNRDDRAEVVDSSDDDEVDEQKICPRSTHTIGATSPTID
jgi:hypothetical protein